MSEWVLQNPDATFFLCFAALIIIGIVGAAWANAFGSRNKKSE